MINSIIFLYTNNGDKMKDKYINLLLNRCLNFNKSKILFINYDVINKDFVSLIEIKANQMGLEVIKDEEDINIYRQKLLTLSLEEIDSDPYFDKSNWDFYAKKGASFLILATEFPNYLDDISPAILEKAKSRERNSKPYFHKMENTYEMPWVIAALPNPIWAQNIYGNIPNAYDKLKNSIYEMCMINYPNPIKAWQDFLKSQKERCQYLNELKIVKLTYKNSLGTNLVIELPDDVIWTSIADDLDYNMIANMPSYEIFTSPHYLKTNGTVYNSKPLFYGGTMIDDFYLKFENGKVVDFAAKKGYEILKGIIESDENSCYLGEVALVNHNSPISNTNIVFKTTLIDENASCHLALGNGFCYVIKDGIKMERDELLKKGINQSLTHVDFMIGTSDLQITASTIDKDIVIFKDGNFIK